MHEAKFSVLRQTFQLRTRPKQNLFRERRKLCRDTTFRVSNEIHVVFVTEIIFLSRQRKLEVEVNVVTTQKWMLRHNNELKADISLTTKENYVATIKVAESDISITTEKFYVTTENGREVR